MLTIWELYIQVDVSYRGGDGVLHLAVYFDNLPQKEEFAAVAAADPELHPHREWLTALMEQNTWPIVPQTGNTATVLLYVGEQRVGAACVSRKSLFNATGYRVPQLDPENLETAIKAVLRQQLGPWTAARAGAWDEASQYLLQLAGQYQNELRLRLLQAANNKPKTQHSVFQEFFTGHVKSSQFQKIKAAVKSAASSDTRASSVASTALQTTS